MAKKAEVLFKITLKLYHRLKKKQEKRDKKKVK